MDQITVSRELLRQVIEKAEATTRHFNIERLGESTYKDTNTRCELHEAVNKLRVALEQPAIGALASTNVCPTCGSDCNERDELIKAEKEIERLNDVIRTALEQPAVEPVAWIYQNANTDNEYLVWKKGTGGRNWRPLFTAPPVQESAVEVNYRVMYLKVRDELAEAQQRLGTCEALARSVMNDQVGRA